MKNISSNTKHDTIAIIQGKRLKEEYKKAGMTQAKFAELTGYADAKCISHICTAERPAANWRFDDFAKVINAHLKNDYVSADYLRGIVDYRNDNGLLSKEARQVFDESDMQRNLEITVLHLLELKGYRMVSRQLANWSEFLQAIASCADRSALAPVHYHVEKYSSMQEWKEGEHLTQEQLDICFENIAAFLPEYLIYEFETPKGKTRIIRRIELENTFRSIEATAPALLLVGMEQTKNYVAPAPQSLPKHSRTGENRGQIGGKPKA